MQFAENLSDLQAADAVRSRLDWKYALGLELTDSGFDASVLSEFRSRLVAGAGERLLLDTMLTVFREHGLLKVRGKQHRLDPCAGQHPHPQSSRMCRHDLAPCLEHPCTCCTSMVAQPR